jgi:hypothetical protein
MMDQAGLTAACLFPSLRRRASLRGEATKHDYFGGAFHPGCGSMRIFVFAGLADGLR